MTPDEFLRNLGKQPLAPAYLFVGPDRWNRDRCRRGLIERALPESEREQGLIRHDLDETNLNTVLDDACSMSLFAAERLILITSAEGAIPRRGGGEDEEGTAKDAGPEALKKYLERPTPGTTLVFDSSRYEFEGDDKAKLQRVQKFYSAISTQVEFERISPVSARRLAQDLIKQAGLLVDEADLDALVEGTAADPSRLAIEIEKLALYAGSRKRITSEDIWNLVPSARSSTIFALVAAIGRGDRTASLHSLDTLVREGEYLPLALTFLATQFRLALVSKEAGLNNAGQILGHFTKLGVPMWRSRAEQVQQTAAAFSSESLREAICKLHETDKAFRDTRPDDRTVMEQLVLALTVARRRN